MKKFLVLSVSLVLGFTLIASGFMLTGCGFKQVVDTTFRFDSAIVSLPDGTVVSGKVQSWMDYEDGDQIQVKIDGTTYLVHSSNIVLIAE